jgi:L-threo-3-deoxy-hexylosonate aldolase
VTLIEEATVAGGEYTLLLDPSYYRGLMDEESIYTYFTSIADQSPLPIVIYNYPGAAAGIDMDSDLLIRLAKHPNIIGTKFTCGNTGKLTRVVLATNAKTPFSDGSGYMALGGMCDFTVQTLVSGESGIIAGGANVMPNACVKVWNLYIEGRIQEAMAPQKILSKDDWVLARAAIAGAKSAVQSYYGYGGCPRSPLKRLDAVQAHAIRDGIAEVMKLEKSL